MITTDILMPEFILRIIDDNSPEQWLTALITSIAVALILIAIRSIGVRRFSRFAQKTHNQIDDVLAETLKNTRFFFVIFVALCVGIQALTILESITSILDGVFLVVLLIQIGLWLSSLIIYNIISQFVLPGMAIRHV